MHLSEKPPLLTWPCAPCSGAGSLVSHDQYFVGRVAKEVWLVGGPKQTVRKIESFDKYREQQLKKLPPMAPVSVS